MRVLHLIDGGFRERAGADLDFTVGACRLLVEHAGAHQRIAVLGPRGVAEYAARAGVPPDVAIAPVLGFPESGWAALRRWVDAHGRPDVYHAWSARAARLALRATGDAVPIVALLAEGTPGPGVIGLTFTPGAREALIEGGVPDVRVVAPPCAARTTPDRESMRRSMGVGRADVLVAQLGAAPQADAVRFAFLIGLVQQAAHRIVGLVSAHAAQGARMRRFLRGRDSLIVRTAERPIRDYLPACDLAVFDGGGPGPTAVWPPSPWAGIVAVTEATSAGIPTIAPAWASENGLYPPEVRDACLAHNSTMPELARKLLRLVDDPVRRGRIAGVLAPPRNGPRFVDAVRDAWEDALAAGSSHG